MIVRRHHDHQLLITQPDHAQLAGELMAEWACDGLPTSPVRHAVLLATREHDAGWSEEDVAPFIDEATGRVFDFLTAPEEVRQRIWPRAVARLRDTPYAAALVAQHAIALYEASRGDDAASPFLDRMQALRAEQLARSAPLGQHDLERDYFFVGIGDLLSLTFCCAWADPQRYAGYLVHWTGSRLTVHPDPFGGRQLRIGITARRLRAAPFASRHEAASEYDRAPVVALQAVAAGS